MRKSTPAANGKTQTEYIGFNAPKGTKKAARRKLGSRRGALTEFLIGALRRLIDGDAAPQPQAQAEPLVISESRAAEMLGVSPPTLRRMRLAGEVAFIEIGGRKLYDPAYLRTEFIPSHRRQNNNGTQEAGG